MLIVIQGLLYFLFINEMVSYKKKWKMQGPLLKGHLLVKELYRYFIYYHNFKTIFTTNLKDNETFSGVDTDLQRKHET